MTLHYAKGMKNQREETNVRHFRPLADPACYYMCPISLLLAYGLRHDLIRCSNTVEEILAYASSRPDRKILWTKSSCATTLY